MNGREFGDSIGPHELQAMPTPETTSFWGKKLKSQIQMYTSWAVLSPRLPSKQINDFFEPIQYQPGHFRFNSISTKEFLEFVQRNT